MKLPLYHFFNGVEHEHGCTNVIEINITDEFTHVQYIYNHFGVVINQYVEYKHYLCPSEENYFGGSPDGFFETLLDFLDRNPNYNLRVNFIAKSNEIEDVDFFILINLFALIRTYNFNGINIRIGSRINVYMSLQLIDFYYKFCYKIMPANEVSV